MEALYQRLKELSKNDFEALIDSLLHSMYPGARIRRVEGAGGDQGIDHFAGTLLDGPIIWQDKHFPNGVRDAQRKQIRKSLKSALKHNPIRWVLCVPVDLTTTAFSWFEKLQREYDRVVAIEIMQASDIVHELMHFKEIRETFFLDAVSDVARLRRIATNTEELSISERLALMREFTDQYIEQLKSLEPRFSYQIISGKQPSPQVGSEPGLVMSFFDGTQTVKVLTRDSTSLFQSGLAVRMEVSPIGAEQISVFQKSGKPQTLEAKDIRSFRLDSKLHDVFNIGNALPSLKLEQQLRPVQTPVSVTVSQRGKELTFPYSLARPLNFGSEQMTMLISGGMLPFEITLDLPFAEAGERTFAIQTQFQGMEVEAALEACQALDMFATDAIVVVNNIETRQELIRAGGLKLSQVPSEAFVRVIRDLISISRYFKTTIRLPSWEPTKNDFEKITEFKRIISGDWFAVENISLTFRRDRAVEQDFPEGGDISNLHFIPSDGVGMRSLFGTPIDTGLIGIHIEKVKIRNFEEFRRWYAAAATDDEFIVECECSSRARFIKQPDPSTAPFQIPISGTPCK